MEMHQVRYFLAVARVLNFTRAAEECNVTQPSLTRSIQKLEEEFGGLLFRRERALTHLTDLGRGMLPHLQRTWDASQAAKALAKQIGKAQVAPLSLGLADSLHAPQITQILRELSLSLSGFELSLKAGSSEEVLVLALRGDVDLAVVEQPVDPLDRLDCWVLYRRNYVVVMRDDHRFSETNGIELVQLQGEAWIESGQADGRFHDHCVAAGVEPMCGHKVAQDSQVQQLVLAGLGCALLPGDIPLLAGLVARSIRDIDLTRAVILGTIAGRYRSPPVEAFIRSARAIAWGAA